MPAERQYSAPKNDQIRRTMRRRRPACIAAPSLLAHIIVEKYWNAAAPPEAALRVRGIQDGPRLDGGAAPRMPRHKRRDGLRCGAPMPKGQPSASQPTRRMCWCNLKGARTRSVSRAGADISSSSPIAVTPVHSASTRQAQPHAGGK